VREVLTELAASVPVTTACAALDFPRSTFYWSRRPMVEKPAPDAPVPPPRGLTAAEKETVREVLNSERFQDSAPRQVYATLLDEGIYYCHWRTMYRILAEQGEVRERRNQLRHPVYTKPELLATAPNQVWSWDITRLKGPVKWSYYYLYGVLDIFSRYVVGWLIAQRESEALACQLIAETCHKQQIGREQLTLHADRGAPMIAKTLAQLLDDLGVDQSHARPHTSDDNPFSEAQFKTMKYRPDYPDRFGSLPHAHSWARPFFHWYNHEHRHTGLALMTPAMVHYGLADQVTQQRQQVLRAAYARHPERFVKGVPIPPQLPDAVWINPPVPDSQPAFTPMATPLSFPALSDEMSGAQVGSRVEGNGKLAALDATEHRTTLAQRREGSPTRAASTVIP
jgi:putative transposase